MNYYQLNQNNEIEFTTSDEEIAQDLGLTLSTEVPIIRGFDGKLYLLGTEPTPPEATYQEKRRLEYPEIPEQLDMIYHDFEGWKSKIAEIKAKYPKI